jgi:GNAT superfamily N-acetyltransferase
MIRLRRLAAGDLAPAVALLSQLGYDMSPDELARRVAEVAATADHALVVAEQAGRAVGLLHLFARPAIENPKEAVVRAIVVDAGTRRSGVGRRLMDYAENWGRERGCRSVTLSSNVTRAPAHAFYDALGYRRSATAYVFRKPL